MSVGYVKPPWETHCVKCGGYLTSGSCTACSSPGTLSEIKTIPDGLPGTTRIIADMRTLVLAAYKDERINQLARHITIDCVGHDYLCEAKTALSWMQEHFRYTRLPWHPLGFQRVQTPSYTLFDAPVKTGECASLTTALAAILMSLGFEVQFRSAGSDASDPDNYEHVYGIVSVPLHGWLAFEPSYPLALGQEHDKVAVRRDWAIA